uniref:Uncharacterized protein n=1 Tax=Trichogramma kaykai TaxID=54128 RepID=A0ABD2XG34_9HYME
MNDRRDIPTNHEARRNYSSTNEVTNKTTSHHFFKEGLLHCFIPRRREEVYCVRLLLCCHWFYPVACDV